MSKRQTCNKCNGTGIWEGFGKRGKCFKCNGKGWVTANNVIRWAAAQRRKDAMVYPAPVQYKD